MPDPTTPDLMARLKDSLKRARAQSQQTTTDPTTPCTCAAYDPVENAHTEAEHTSCGWSGQDTPCGGCDSCISAQAHYYRRLREEAGNV